MDRQTLAQTVAMLVVLGILVRWLPPTGNVERHEDWFGRGAPIDTLTIDRQVAREDPHDPRVVALMMMGSSRRPVFRKRYYEFLKVVREIQPRMEPDHVVQLRNFLRNEFWMLRYFLYPQPIVGRPLQEGDDATAPVHPEADWLFTAGDLTAEGGVEKSGPPRLDRVR